MLSQTDQNVFRALDGKKHSFFLLNVDIHKHSALLAGGGEDHDVGIFYRLSSTFFELAVELNHGLVAPWQGDGGFAIFDSSQQEAFQNVWNAASDFLVPYQNQVLRNLLNRIKTEDRTKWTKNYPEFYSLIDRVEFVFDFNSPGNWCGYGLSFSLKNFKRHAKPRKLAISKAAYKEAGIKFWDGRGLKSPHGEVYSTNSLGPDLIIGNPRYRDEIYKQQADNIAIRNLLTEALIEKGFSSRELLVWALYCLAQVFKGREDVATDGFRASVWRRNGNHLEFAWGFPHPSNFKIASLKGKKSRFAIGEGCAGEVWKTGKLRMVSDVKKDEKYCEKHDSHSDESAAFFPLLPKERSRMLPYSPNDLLGVLCIGVTKESTFKFKNEDQRLMESYVTPFALNMALAIKSLNESGWK